LLEMGIIIIFLDMSSFMYFFACLKWNLVLSNRVPSKSVNMMIFDFMNKLD